MPPYCSTPSDNFTLALYYCYISKFKIRIPLQHSIYRGVTVHMETGNMMGIRTECELKDTVAFKF